MKWLGAYLCNLLVAVDQFLNTLAFGDPDETLSSRLMKLSSRCALCRAICRFLNRIDARHCEKSIELDEGKNGIIE